MSPFHEISIHHRGERGYCSPRVPELIQSMIGGHAAQAARHLSQYCPDIRAIWRVSVQAEPDPVMVWGCVRPPTGQPRPELDAHIFLLAAGDSLPHPQLRRPPVIDRSGPAGSSA